MSASAEKSKRRESIVRMQISHTNTHYQKNLELEANSDRDLVESEDKQHEIFVSYIQALTGSSRRRIPLVWMEHSYARTSVPGATESSTRSAPRLLLVKTPPQCPDCHSDGEDEESIDIESVDVEPTPPLALDELPQFEKALDETELAGEEEDGKPDWEDKLNSLPWNSSQVYLLNGAMELISSLRGAYLTSGRNGARRAGARGGAARGLRQLLASPPVYWQTRHVQWLHNALMEHLPPPMLNCYKDIVLTLKSKIPSLIEKMTIGHPVSGRVRGFENGSGGPMIASGHSAPSEPGAPLLLLLPSGRDKRDARWAERLRAVAQVHQVHSHQSNWVPQLPVSACLSLLVGQAKSRVSMLKTEHPHRPLILVGQGPGAAIAVQLAVNISGIAGVVCLGLPILTADGPRGDPEDSILSLPCPILFVTGQNASQSSQQDVESLRVKLRVKSRLVVAGSADDLLRLPRVKRQLEGVTQRMLECAIAEEVGNFLTCLTQWDDATDPDVTPGSPSETLCDTEYLLPSQPPPTITTTGVSPLSTVIPSTAPLTPPPPTSPSPNNITQPQKRKGGKNITMPKSKKPKTVRAIKSTSPLKGRGMTLYHVNNPPPEGASISLSVLLNTPQASDTFNDSIEKSPAKTMKSEPASYVQITNSRLTKSFPLSGAGSTSDNKSSSGIKVLENIPIKMSTVVTPKGMGNSVSGLANTPLVLPRKIDSQSQSNAVQSPITSANIMDIPIIFADDEKVSPSKPPSIISQTTVSKGIKSIIINKSPLVNSSNTTPTKNVILKVPPNSTTGGTSTPTICFKQSITNSAVKYTKLIVTKRTPEKTPQTVNIVSKQDTNTINTGEAQKKILTKPIIVKSKTGPMTAFKVLPGGILQKSSNIIPQPRQLIIKKTISGIKAGPMKPAVDSRSDRAIEAAVASISSEADSVTGNDV